MKTGSHIPCSGRIGTKQQLAIKSGIKVESTLQELAFDPNKENKQRKCELTEAETFQKSNILNTINVNRYINKKKPKHKIGFMQYYDFHCPSIGSCNV